MIGWLRGQVLRRDGEAEVLLDVQGVGYRVTVPASTAASLEVGAGTELFVHTHVREDAIVLYGFPTMAERRSFEVVLTAHGVGPSLALAIVSALRPEALARAVIDDDLDTLCAIPGVGRKTAARLALDLKTRVAATDLPASFPSADGSSHGARGEARAALVELGYGPDEIRRALDSGDGDATVEELLRQALRQLAASR